MIDSSKKNMKKAEAISRNIRGSVLKLNLVADLIRRKNAIEALNVLQFSKKRVSKLFYECLKSAIANAKHNLNLVEERLYIESVFVGKDKILRRFMPRGRGKSSRVNKIYSRIKIVLGNIV